LKPPKYIAFLLYLHFYCIMWVQYNKNTSGNTFDARKESILKVLLHFKEFFHLPKEDRVCFFIPKADIKDNNVQELIDIFENLKYIDKFTKDLITKYKSRLVESFKVDVLDK